jgi:hypothetical protein
MGGDEREILAYPDRSLTPELQVNAHVNDEEIAKLRKAWNSIVPETPAR